MKIATWNVNSMKVRLPHVLEWLAANGPDVLVLQEIKQLTEAFPAADLREAGYESLANGQKTYNGVAVISRSTPEDPVLELPDLDDPQRRVLATTIDGVRVVNLYVPNGQAVGSEKYEYKLGWLDALRRQVAAELAEHADCILLGDFNIAPDDRDVHDPAAWEGKVLCSEPERDALGRLLELGFADAFRNFDQEEKSFSWWDYRAAALRRNMGLRIDLILATSGLIDRCTACRIDVEPRRLERPSDHTPVIAEFSA